MNDRKLILFDIDGTLVTRISREASRKQRAFTQAVEIIYGVAGVNYMNHDIFGLTDRGILDLVLQENGVSPATIESGESAFIPELCRIYQDGLSDAPPEYMALPGVMTLLESLKDHTLGLATGNFEMIASHKLADAGIQKFFTFGGYGEDASDRGEIVAAAIERFSPGDTASGYLFGDTPHDITAGQKNSLRVGAVATGRFTRGKLQSLCLDGDVVFDDFSDTRTVLTFLGVL